TVHGGTGGRFVGTGSIPPLSRDAPFPIVKSMNEGSAAMTPLLIQYGYLQLLDLLTTAAFLVQGVREGNPLVRFAIETAPTPLGGLFAVKILAMILGLYCWRTRKAALLGRVIALFAILIAWNMVALILGSALPNSLS